jgi:hypothetical protein
MIHIRANIFYKSVIYIKIPNHEVTIHIKKKITGYKKIYSIKICRLMSKNKFVKKSSIYHLNSFHIQIQFNLFKKKNSPVFFSFFSFIFQKQDADHLCLF